MTYDELYGVTLDEYCRIHNTTIEKLIKKTEIDIDLLKKRLASLVFADEMDIYLVNEVHKLLSKKRKHLKRLKQWKKEAK